MVPFPRPEILISDLSSLVLELASWGVKDPRELAWLDTPPVAPWESAKSLLTDLGALDQSGRATPEGKEMARLPLHPRLARLMVRARELSVLPLGADLAALLSERDIVRSARTTPGVPAIDPDLTERLEILREWRKRKKLPVAVDPWTLRSVDRTSKQLSQLVPHAPEMKGEETTDADMVSRLLLCAFPDRIGRRRENGDGRFVLSNGRGVRLIPSSSVSRSRFVIAVTVDAGEKTEGVIHVAAPVSEELIRQELAGNIGTLRRVQWDKRRSGIVASREEWLGSLLLSEKPFHPSDEEAAPLLCEAVRATPGLLHFSREARQFQRRVALMRRIFPEETWPDLSDPHLSSDPGGWLLPWLNGVRSARDLENLDMLPAMKALLSWALQRRLDALAPASLVVPSGHRVVLDYTSGDIPVLAVKLQEMFGLADTPTVAEGRIKVLLHLLSPARRPIQVTQDLKAFWDSGYQLVKKELKGRYPRHPWPDDPWNALPTRNTKSRNR
jgi:ATP-dependent helicase HrpB